MAVVLNSPFSGGWGSATAPTDASGAPLMPPDILATQRQYGLNELQQGIDASPVRSWTQGAARLAQALMGGMAYRNANQKEMQYRSQAMQSLIDAMNGTPSASGSGASSGTGTVGATDGTASAGTGATASPSASGGAAPPAAPPKTLSYTPGAGAGGGGPDLNKLMLAASNPYLSPGAASIANAIMGHEFKLYEPMKLSPGEYVTTPQAAMASGTNGQNMIPGSDIQAWALRTVSDPHADPNSRQYYLAYRELMKPQIITATGDDGNVHQVAIQQALPPGIRPPAGWTGGEVSTPGATPAPSGAASPASAPTAAATPNIPGAIVTDVGGPKFNAAKTRIDVASSTVGDAEKTLLNPDGSPTDIWNTLSSQKAGIARAVPDANKTGTINKGVAGMIGGPKYRQGMDALDEIVSAYLTITHSSEDKEAVMERIIPHVDDPPEVKADKLNTIRTYAEAVRQAGGNAGAQPAAPAGAQPAERVYQPKEGDRAVNPSTGQTIVFHNGQFVDEKTGKPIPVQ